MDAKTDPTTDPPLIGFIGPGQMGLPMVRNLLQADCSVVAHDLKAGEDEGEVMTVLYLEVSYFLREADKKGFELPLARAFYEFCAAGEPVAVERRHGPVPSFWRQLMAS